MLNLPPIDTSDRRVAERRSALDVHICLVDLGQGRSAMLLDVSETGIGVQTVEGPGEGLFAAFRFTLPDTQTVIAGEAELAWADRAGRMGLRFTSLAPEMRTELRNWITSEANPLFADAPVTEEIADLDARDRVAQLEARIIVSGWAQLQAINFLVDQIAAMTQASGVAIAVEDGSGIVCKASSGIAPQVGVRVDPRSGLSWECVRTREVVQCIDTETDPRVDRIVCRQLNMRSAMLVPVMKEGRVAGLVEVFSSRPRAFNNQTVILLRRVGEAVASLDETAPEILSEDALIPMPVEPPAAPAVAAGEPSRAAAPVAVAPAPPPVVAPQPMVAAVVPTPPQAAPDRKTFSEPAVAVAPVVVPAPKPIAAPVSVAPAAAPSKPVEVQRVSETPKPAPVPVVTSAPKPVVRVAEPAIRPAPPIPAAAPTIVSPPAVAKAVVEVKTVPAAPVVIPPSPAAVVTPPATAKTEKVSSSAPMPKVEAKPAEKPVERVPARMAPLPAVAFSGAAAAAAPARSSDIASRVSETKVEPIREDSVEVFSQMDGSGAGSGRKIGIAAAVLLLVGAISYGAWYMGRPRVVYEAAAQPAPAKTETSASAPATTPTVTPAVSQPPAATPAAPAAKAPVPVAPASVKNVPAAKQPVATPAVEPMVLTSSGAPHPNQPEAAAPSVLIASPNTLGVASILSSPVPTPALQQRVSQGVTGGRQITRVQPIYPQAARSMHVSGIVTLRAHVDKTGSVTQAQVVKGHPILNSAAVEAVRRWKYQPFLLNGQPIENDVNVEVRFDLPQL